MALPQRLKQSGDRGLGILALAAIQALDLPEQVTYGVIGILIYGMIGDRRSDTAVRALAEVPEPEPTIDPVLAAEVLEQCRRAEIDPYLVAAAMAQQRPGS